MPLENPEKQKGKNQTKKHSYGKDLLISTLLVALYNNIKPHGLSSLLAFFITLVQTILAISFLYFLTLWIVDLIRRRGKIERPENEKIRTIINITFTIIFLLNIASLLMKVF